jgi:hypothetical protein
MTPGKSTAARMTDRRKRPNAEIGPTAIQE